MCTHAHPKMCCVFEWGGALANNGDFPFHYVLEFQQLVMKSRLIKTIERCVLFFLGWLAYLSIGAQRSPIIAAQLERNLKSKQKKNHISS